MQREEPAATITQPVEEHVEKPVITSGEDNHHPHAYCLRCKSTVIVKNPVEVTMRNGRPAIQGFCPNCGARVFKPGRA